MAQEVRCDGWWHQAEFGRQTMRELCLRFGDGRITGSGRDLIGSFTFSGRLDDQGRIAMTKRYAGRHSVHYVGQYDGEGLLWGQWHISLLSDRWMIKIARTATAGELAAAASMKDVRDLWREL